MLQHVDHAATCLSSRRTVPFLYLFNLLNNLCVDTQPPPGIILALLSVSLCILDGRYPGRPVGA